MGKAVGKPNWQWVTIDSPGVPRGGAFGCVKWFDKQCKRHNLHLVWSWKHNCFMVATKIGPKYICQEIYRRDIHGSNSRVVVLTPRLFEQLMWLWRRAVGGNSARAFQVRAQQEEAYQARVQQDYQAALDAVRPDAIQRLELKLGRTPTVMVMPETITSTHGKDAASRRKRIRRRRVIETAGAG